MFLSTEYFGSLGIRLDEGLSDQEIGDAEDIYGFRFPPDLRELLQSGLPTGRGFVDWRNGSVEDIRYILDGPFDGICFDIEHNNFWLDNWGEKPETLTDSFAVAKTFIDRAPKLIPVYGHRYIPDTPMKEEIRFFLWFKRILLLMESTLRFISKMNSLSSMT